MSDSDVMGPATDAGDTTSDFKGVVTLQGDDADVWMSAFFNGNPVPRQTAL